MVLLRLLLSGLVNRLLIWWWLLFFLLFWKVLCGFGGDFGEDFDLVDFMVGVDRVFLDIYRVLSGVFFGVLFLWFGFGVKRSSFGGDLRVVGGFGD